MQLLNNYELTEWHLRLLLYFYKNCNDWVTMTAFLQRSENTMFRNPLEPVEFLVFCLSSDIATSPAPKVIGSTGARGSAGGSPIAHERESCCELNCFNILYIVTLLYYLIYLFRFHNSVQSYFVAFRHLRPKHRHLINVYI